MNVSRDKQEWRQKTLKPVLERFPERRNRFVTTSGMEIDHVYTAGDFADFDYAQNLGYPGEYPFIRGIQPTMYRGRLWTMRQYAGFRGSSGI
jgi:methylmalonyl-CoA mutase N-terminal domain/subunit